MGEPKVMMKREFLSKEFSTIAEMLTFLNNSKTIVPVSVIFVGGSYVIIYCELIPIEVKDDKPEENKP